MYYQLNNSDTQESLGLIKAIKLVDNLDEEIRDSWNDFHVLEEHDLELDNCDIDDFVQWHNENYVSQIERIFVEVI